MLCYSLKGSCDIVYHALSETTSLRPLLALEILVHREDRPVGRQSHSITRNGRGNFLHDRYFFTPSAKTERTKRDIEEGGHTTKKRKTFWPQRKRSTKLFPGGHLCIRFCVDLCFDPLRGPVSGERRLFHELSGWISGRLEEDT